MNVEPCEVIEKDGAQVLVRGKDSGQIYTRSTGHVKKIPPVTNLDDVSTGLQMDTSSDAADATSKTMSEVHREDPSVTSGIRSTRRAAKPPARWRDFI